MIRIAIILGSTRPGRKGEAVAKWVYEIAQKRSDADFELVDVKDFNLPLLDEPMSPIMGQAAGFVGYGGASGIRAVENLRLVMGELQVADVKAQVGLSLFTDFEDFSVFKPHPQHERSVNTMLDQVIAWGGALKSLRK
jgi:NAD(P)H-dependent FMN reductase